MRINIINGSVLDSEFKWRNCDVTVKDGIIEKLGASENCDEMIDAKGMYVIPGLVDTHTHGAYGYDYTSKKAEELYAIAAFEASCGITTIVPSISTTSNETFESAMKMLSDAFTKEYRGAHFGGIHLEGPFLSLKHRGAQPSKYLQQPSIEWIQKMQSLARGYVKIITIAPELDNAIETIKFAADNGIIVELGHTGAKYETALQAIEAGASVSTHTFNGMAQLHHRDVGILGAVLTENAISCEMICDLVHIHAPIIKLIYAAKGDDRINVVSDSMCAAGVAEGRYMQNGIERFVSGGVSRCEDGTISGSASTIADGIRNLVSIGIPLESAVKMASYNPARTIGLDSRIGSIKEGKDADIVILNNELKVERVILKGEVFL